MPIHISFTIPPWLLWAAGGAIVGGVVMFVAVNVIFANALGRALGWR